MAMKLLCDRPIIHTHRAEWPKLDIACFAREPSLFSNSPASVRIQGGQLAKTALAFVEKEYAPDIARAQKAGLSAIVDVRVQRLMPGMFPSIPGWHCDAVPRNSYHGQPDFELINPAAFHVCLLLSTEPGGVSNTQFVDQPGTYNLWVAPFRTVYKQLSELVTERKPHTCHIKDGEFVRFTPKTIHRAMPCGRRGWRMFFRFSMYHKPPIENGIPSQQQVYILSEENGW